MAIKIDMANAFDRANHFFLLEIMLKLGFSNKFIRRIKTCISPLINDKPTGFFPSL